MFRKIVVSLFFVAFVASCCFKMDVDKLPVRLDAPIRVACVGDSITFGMGTSDGMSYPSQLQNLLGDGYTVGNFGVSARTLMRSGDLPWWNEPQFQAAQDFAPDMVIIMLGTNDTKPQNWEHKDDFYADYAALVNVFAALPSQPKIYVCRPCPVPEPGNWGINETNIQLEMKMLDQLAQEKGLGLIDMHAALADHPELLPDRVHPNDEGSLLMAKAAYDVIAGPAVNSYFADHMVLQRGVKVPVWGTAPDGEPITVRFGGQVKRTVAKDGHWTVKLKAMKANANPQVMAISDRQGTRYIRDVLVGDVWVASGQSNMERELGPTGGQKDIVGWEEAVAAADYPLIRQYQIPLNTSIEPLEDGNGAWSVCSPETAAGFCAVGYFFIRDVYEAEQIPMALLHTTWGGTPAEAWTSMEKLKTVADYKVAAETVEQLRVDPSVFNDLRANWYDENDEGTINNWWKENLSLDGWKSVTVPTSLDQQGMGSYDGVVWFRKTFEISAADAGKPAVLNLGVIDDNDVTWLNGQKIGATDGWNLERSYSIPAGVLKAGKNQLAVQVIDTASWGGWGSSSGDPELIIDGSKTVALAGSWSQRLGGQFVGGAEFYMKGQLDQNSPTMLYNAMINPILPMPITGVIWYQGEANNGQADKYDDLFAAMIQDWRARWNSGKFPFLYVQIAPHQDMTPELREAQRLVLEREPNTAMTVTVDVGDATDIHPARKEPVGQRLALAARALAYGEKIEYSGPLYKSMRVKDGRAVIRFTHVGERLTAKDGALKGFEIAGADGNFVPAQAEIDGKTVVVSSDSVAEPIAVRYGWNNVPDVNLFNKDGLPASPFFAEK
ncbi:MAG: beta galactosidase jelly roll domain-containing protein [Pontiellaceae bacterium]|nr:beta galactosidase jelly roll domain-containing protein [Pontiellaceae bacterium]